MKAEGRRKRNTVIESNETAIANVLGGLEGQYSSIERIVSGINEMAASLKETANQAASVTDSTE